ncbi:hypothetical protein CDAR_88871 [Caerostris darwini]|uniref:Uncharacterized protein n=1 Tax=Caerostris darwini TaxID=1538125 RepID=A0AAV4SXS5_9ARAC|nr:hypothetical protein CDAR_88871 [Caerostris darwini]
MLQYVYKYNSSYSRIGAGVEYKDLHWTTAGNNQQDTDYARTRYIETKKFLALYFLSCAMSKSSISKKQEDYECETCEYYKLQWTTAENDH